MKLNTGISDLWFYHDHSAYSHRLFGDDPESARSSLIAAAGQFIDSLEAAGVEVEFSENDLVEDFFRRL